jgi:hypothetical protein
MQVREQELVQTFPSPRPTKTHPIFRWPIEVKINLRRSDTNVVFESQLGVDANSLIKRRKNVATLAKSKPDASADQVQRFERKIREVKQAIANLPGDEYHEELLKIVRRVGWTTLAEGIFFEAMVESILAHTRDLTQLHQRLKAAFEAVQDK